MPDAEHTLPRVMAGAAAAQAQARAVAAAFGAAAAAAAHQQPFTLPSSANHFTNPGAPPFAPPYASPHAAFAPRTSFGTVAPHFGYAPVATSAAAAAASSAAASVVAVGAPAKKARKPYTITRQRENWTAEEHQLFSEALKKHGRDWKQIEGCVKTKNVIQVRSHAQKYFNRVKKNKTGEHIPPPRPKRKNSVPVPPTQPLAQASGSPLATPPLSLSYSASSSLLKPAPSSHAFSPAASPLMPSSAPPLTRAPPAPLSPSFLQMQNALRSNLVAREAPGADALDRGASLVSEATSSGMTVEAGFRRSLSTPRNLNRGAKRQQGTPPVRRLSQPKVPRTDPIGISHRKATGLASYITTPLLSGTQYSGVVGSPMSVETTTAETPQPQSCPNFAKIYAFFANLFDPHRTYDLVTGMHAASLTALDKEIIKLLITNLETNISNEGNPKELLETYRTQISPQQT